jgi:Fe-S oxidoreductase
MSPTQQWYGPIPGWFPYSLAIALALFLFLRRSYYLFRLLRTARPARRWDRIGERLKGVLIYVLGQKRLIGGDLWPGLMHATIFWGFIVLTVGTLEFFGRGFAESFVLPLVSGQPYFLVMQDLLSVGVILAVGYAAFRRLVTKPKRLTLSAEGLIILLLIFGLMATDLLADGARMRLSPEATDRWAFAGSAVSWLYAGLPLTAVRGWYVAFWWLHGGILLGFLAWLPCSKHLHVIAAPFNVFFRPLTPKGEFPSLDLEASETFGVGRITEFSWKDLFDLYNCTECGRCTAGCPANLSGKELDPKLLILNLQQHLLEQGPKLLARAGTGARREKGGEPEAGREMKGGRPQAGREMTLLGGVVHDNVLWACTTCRHCVEACPVFIEHVPKIIDMRRFLVLSESRFPKELGPLFRNLETNGNPWPLSWQARADWARDLGVKVMAEVGRAEYLYWVGCYGAFDERNRKVARAVVRILQAANVPFAILGNEEKCTGEPARRAGHEYLFQTLAQGNIETLRQYRIQTIVTACPHCFNTLRNEYPQFGGLFRVVHHTQLIDELIRAGRLRIARVMDGRATYHDPCYLGRYNDVYDPPRRVIRAVSRGELVEMHQHRDKCFCCGGGGGRVWLEEHEGRRVNQIRVEQAMEVNPRLLASACPFCLTMFEDGVRGKGVADTIRTRDIAELVADAIR